MDRPYVVQTISMQHSSGFKLLAHTAALGTLPPGFPKFHVLFTVQLRRQDGAILARDVPVPLHASSLKEACECVPDLLAWVGPRLMQKVQRALSTPRIQTPGAPEPAVSIDLGQLVHEVLKEGEEPTIVMPEGVSFDGEGAKFGE